MLCVLQRPVINCVHFVQVEDIDKKFSELEEIKENNWEEKKVEVKKNNVKVRAAGRLFQRPDPFQDRFVCLGGGGGGDLAYGQKHSVFFQVFPRPLLYKQPNS
jgi:hypothetical protein